MRGLQAHSFVAQRPVLVSAYESLWLTSASALCLSLKPTPSHHASRFGNPTAMRSGYSWLGMLYHIA